MTVTYHSVLVALYDYTPLAGAEDEVAIKEDQMILLLDGSDEDWWKVKIKTNSQEDHGESGLVPKAYVEEAKPIATAKALYDYAANGDGELGIAEDELLLVFEQEVEWTLVKSTKPGGKAGYVPAAYIELSGSAQEEAVSAPLPPASAAAARSDYIETWSVSILDMKDKKKRGTLGVGNGAIFFASESDKTPVQQWRTSLVVTVTSEKAKYVNIQIASGDDITTLRFVANTRDISEAIMEKVESSRLIATSGSSSGLTPTTQVPNPINTEVTKHYKNGASVWSAKSPDYVVIPKAKVWETERPGEERAAKQAARSSRGPRPGKTRIWHDRTGQFKVEAEFLGMENGKIRLHKTNGVIIGVPSAKMSPEDMAFISFLMNAGKSPTTAPDDDKVPLSVTADRRVPHPPTPSRPVPEQDGTFWLRDARSGNPIGHPYEGHIQGINSVAFSPNGTSLASRSNDDTSRVWDIRTGRQVGEPLKRDTASVTAVAFPPSGRRNASGSQDNTVMENELDPYIMDENERHAAEGHEFEGHVDQIDQTMSVQDMLQLLSRHGCIILDSRMDPSQESAILLSGGGFGDVWRGQLLDGSKVAIKAWRASVIEQCDYKMLKRATREIHYWSKMKHANVHKLMGVIAFKGQSLGMVSEWMENGNLHEYLRRSPQADRLKLSSQVASGLAYVHDCGVIHGDIKALNVLVSSDGVAKLTDFGLSTMSESSIVFSSSTTTMAGSVRWMAPELLLEELPKSKGSDIYALGMTILETFTSKLPYSEYRRDVAITMMVMQNTLPTRPLTEFPENGRGNRIWNLLMTCWEKDPNARPSVKRVVESLELVARI